MVCDRFVLVFNQGVQIVLLEIKNVWHVLLWGTCSRVVAQVVAKMAKAKGSNGGGRRRQKGREAPPDGSVVQIPQQEGWLKWTVERRVKKVSWSKWIRCMLHQYC